MSISPAALREGDSGFWVVDNTLNQVYGHVAAVDDFGEAYIIPLEDTFRDMVSTLGVFSLHIAQEAEVPRIGQNSRKVNQYFKKTK